MTSPLESPEFEAKLDKMLALLEAGQEVDLAELAGGNPEHQEGLVRAMENYGDIGSRQWRSMAGTSKKKQRARRLLDDHPEFDGYRLTGILGEGGCSVVFAAEEFGPVKTMGEDIREHTEVAIKVFTSDSYKDSLKKEYASLKILGKAESIPDIYRYGEVDGLPYLVMEKAQGSSLDKLLEPDAPLPRFRAEKILLGICRALVDVSRHASSNLNRKDIIHGDLKPQNVVVSDDDEVMLLDFSIAMLRAPKAGKLGENTLSSSIGYTPNYASPEVLVDKPCQRITVASDIFQIGLIGYRLFTGQEYWEVSSEKRQTALQDIPGDMAVALKRALNWDPECRFRSAKALLRVLKPGPVSRVMHSSTMAWFAAAIVLAVVVVPTCLAWKWKGQNDALSAEIVALKLDRQSQADKFTGQIATLKATNSQLSDDLKTAKEALVKKGAEPIERWLIRSMYREFKTQQAKPKDVMDECETYLDKFEEVASAKDYAKVQAIHDYLAKARAGIRVEIRPWHLYEKNSWGTYNLMFKVFHNGKLVYESTNYEVDDHQQLDGKPISLQWHPFDITEIQLITDGTITRKIIKGLNGWRLFQTLSTTKSPLLTIPEASTDPYGKFFYAVAVHEEMPTPPPLP